MEDPRKWAGELARHMLYVPKRWWHWTLRRAEREGDPVAAPLSQAAWHYGYGAQLVAIHADGEVFLICQQDPMAAEETGGGEQLAAELAEYREARREYEKERRAKFNARMNARRRAKRARRAGREPHPDDAAEELDEDDEEVGGGP